MITARHSGKMGDIIYSLPAAKAMGVEVFYIPETTDQCSGLNSSIRSLLLQQSWIKEVREYPWLGGVYGKYNKDPDIQIHFDLDRHQEHPLRGKRNMVLRYADVFGLKLDHTIPWLTIKGPRLIDHEYNLINLTNRFRDNSTVNWKRVLSKIEPPVYFIGTIEEHAHFVEKYGTISRLPTTDFLNFAMYVRDCKALYCNQSAALVIRQSQMLPYHCEFKLRKTNCYFYTPNEHQLI